VSDSTYQAARAQYSALRERLPQARAGYLPIITGTAGTFRNDIDFEIAPDQRLLDVQLRRHAEPARVPHPELDRDLAADKLVLQAEANLAFQSEELAIRVAQAYFDVLLAQDNVALSGAQKTAISSSSPRRSATSRSAPPPSSTRWKRRRATTSRMRRRSSTRSTSR
jgi:outer membrane protein